MKTFYVLGIDQSTQGTKAVIFDAKGYLLKRVDVPHRQRISEQGWISHSPSEIYENVLKACKEVVSNSGVDPSAIRCMGITNQRETTVVWDKVSGKELADAVVWQCNRAKDICRDILEKYQCGQIVYKKTGLKLSPYYPAAKMAWLIENIPKVKEKMEEGKVAFGTIDSWLLFKLTEGRVHRTEYSNASRTQLLNLETLEWDKEICRYFGINENSLPEIVASDHLFGKTTLGGFLEHPIPICGMIGDSHGALFGHDCRQPGKIKATYGTGASVMLNTGTERIFSKHGLSTSIGWKVDGKITYVLEGNINYAGAVISWLKEDLGMIRQAKETEQFALQADQEDETYIVPAFSGLGAPWWNSDAKAMIVGMSRKTGKKELIKAACDCIAHQIQDVIDAMEGDTGLKIKELCVDGGPTRNQYLMQFQSDMAEARIRIPQMEEVSVAGACYLAAMSAGVYERQTAYQAMHYECYTAKMQRETKMKKRQGWKQAIQMLCK
ncbi:glycerol kinase GlpK [Suipraeoptans intestinalis]|uniref:FGGY-family carbohydrate kinase n=1 Tax=Suipraeoptans intestinalis TaxID=2606628 RepID=UPI002A749D77|nr:glycerol kinase GlpK [Suipraeoptans intestinalis]MDY3121971.1 glycerol kinase GlpK [Suipraeoptans intestinalis]